MIKQIPNIFTLLNLFFGCMAVVYILQPGLVPMYSTANSYLAAELADNGTQYINIPEQVFMASVFIGIASVIDFLDGFVARLLGATSEMGKQLDSLADVVSFGVAPGMIMYQFLRLAYAQQEDGLNTNIAWLLPAFILPCAGAYRLARFNIDKSTSYGFKGVPIPAAGLCVASFPLIFWNSEIPFVSSLFINVWFLYAVILVLSWLMVSTLPMMAFKFKNFSFKDNWPKFLMIAVIIIAALIFHWLAVPVAFILYVLLSLLLKQKQ